MIDKRFEISSKYIKGKGLEIGALQNPLPVTDNATIIYVDKIDVPTARSQIYSEMKDYDFVNVDVLDDGEKLHNIPNESQNFVIANHFLEHTQDPIGTVTNHLTKIKVGGILFYAIPDQMGFCDTKRPLTSFDHLLKDHKEGPQVSYDSHMREWVELSMDTPKEKQENEIERLKKLNYAIHFHVWNNESFRNFLEKTKVFLNNSFEILDFITNDTEHICLLKKTKSQFNQNMEHLLSRSTNKPIDDLMMVYARRKDLRDNFPEAKNGKDISNLVRWAKNFGVYEELPLSPHVNIYKELCK